MKGVAAAAVLLLTGCSTALARQPLGLGTGATVSATAGAGGATLRQRADPLAAAHSRALQNAFYPSSAAGFDDDYWGGDEGWVDYPDSSFGSGGTLVTEEADCDIYNDDGTCWDSDIDGVGAALGTSIIIAILAAICVCCVPCIVAGVVLCCLLKASQKRKEQPPAPPAGAPIPAGYEAQPYVYGPGAPIGVALGGPPPQWGPAPGPQQAPDKLAEGAGQPQHGGPDNHSNQ